MLGGDRPAEPSKNEEHAQMRFEGEVGVMQWLKERSSIPVPEIYNVTRGSTAGQATFVAMERIPGECVLNVFGNLTYPVKVSMRARSWYPRV